MYRYITNDDAKKTMDDDESTTWTIWKTAQNRRVNFIHRWWRTIIMDVCFWRWVNKFISSYYASKELWIEMQNLILINASKLQIGAFSPVMVEGVLLGLAWLSSYMAT